MDTRRLILALVVLLIVNPLGAQCVQEIGVWPHGPAKAAAFSDEFLVYNDGRLLEVADITDLTAPETMGEFLLDAAPSAIIVYQDYVYAFDGFRKLEVINRSEPENLTKIAEIDLGLNAIDVELVGDVICVLGSSENGSLPVLKVMSLSNPRSPATVGEVTLPGVVVHGSDYLLAASGSHAIVLLNRELLTVDLTEPSNPQVVGTVAFQTDVTSLACVSGFAYVRDAEYLHVVDLRQPEQPFLVSSVEAGVNPEVLFSDSCFLFELWYSGTHRITAYDLSDPTSPAPAGETIVDGSVTVNSLCANQGRLAVAMGDGELVLIDASSIDQLIRAAEIMTPVGFAKTTVQDGVAYVTGTYARDLRIFDLASEDSPILAGAVDLPAKDIAIKGSHMYVVATGFFVEYDLEDPLHPTEIARLEIPSNSGMPIHPSSIAIEGDRAYFMAYATSSLFTVDISQPGSPELIAAKELSAGGALSRMFVRDGLIYGIQYGLWIIDARDEQNPLVLSHVYIRDAHDLAFDNPVVFLVSGDTFGELSTYDVSEPDMPVLMSQVPVTGIPSAVDVLGTQAFVAESGAGIRVFDVEDALAPIAKDLSSGCGFATAARLMDEAMLVATKDSGLALYDVEQCDPLANSLFIPAAASSPGSDGAHWISDVDVANVLDSPLGVHFRLLDRGEDNSGKEFTEFRDFEPNTSERFKDLWGTYGGEGSGAIQVRTSRPDHTVVASRIFNSSGEGTYGQGIPAVDVDDLIPFGERARLLLLTQNQDFRTNIGFLNPNSFAIDLTVVFLAADGTELGREWLSLQAKSSAQWNSAFRRTGEREVEDGFVEVWTTSEEARFYAYASVVDQNTGDPMTVLPQTKGSHLLPAAASIEGIGGSYWTTDLELNNGSDLEISYHFRLFPVIRTIAEPRYPKSFGWRLIAAFGTRMCGHT